MLQLILFFLYSIVFCYIVYKLKYCRDEDIKPFVFPLFFCIKLFFGFLFYMVYTYYYADRATADMYKYFDDSKPLFECLIHDPSTFYQIVLKHDVSSSQAVFYLSQMNHWQLGYHRQFENSHQIIILFNVLCRFFSFGQLLPHLVFINFLSFLGLVGIWKSFRLFFPHKKIYFLFPVFLVPSVLFWCSGLLKESLIVFVLGFFLHSFFSLLKSDNHRWKHILCFVFFYFLLFQIKSYVAIAFLPMIVIGIAVRISNFRYVAASFLVGCILILGLGFGIQTIFPSINPSKALNEKIYGFKEVMNAADPKSSFDIGSNEHMDTKDIIRLVPSSIAVCLFRPFPWEAKNPFTILVVLENFFLWSCMLMSLRFFFKDKQYIRLQGIQVYCLLSIVCVVCILYFIIGISSFNFGAMVRYKAPMLPFLFAYPIMLISDKFVEKANNLKIIGLFCIKRS